MKTAYIGKPESRVDGQAKVTGQARYAGEFGAPNLAYGYVVSSAVARGRITRLDASAALGQKGVLQVFSHENTPQFLGRDEDYRDQLAPVGTPFRPFCNDIIRYSSQPVALVVADSFELSRYAASLIKVEYAQEEHATDLADQLSKAYEPPGRPGYEPPPPPRGHAERALLNAAVCIEAEYSHPIEHHNPMEPHATTVLWHDDDTLTIHDKTQGVYNSKEYVCKLFGLSPEQVRVVTPFVGGAFGLGLRPQYQLFLAVLAARELKRSVRVTLTREQMFSLNYRPTTRHKLELGAGRDGKLVALTHEAFSNTSRFEHYCETVVNWSSVLYQCDNTRLAYKIAQLDLNTPIDMRAPGAASGVFALECAMDELSYKLNIDPLELRLVNYAEVDQDNGRPFSSKELRACYREGAKRFGWAQRPRPPRSLREGDTLIGWGMATGIWDAGQAGASARAVLHGDGKLRVSSASMDIGPGTYTIMTQIAADLLGLPIANVSFTLGDTTMPQAPIEGGSMTAASVGSAVKAVCEKLREKLFQLAKRTPGSPLGSASLKDVMFENASMRLQKDPQKSVTLEDAMRHGKVSSLQEEATAAPDRRRQGHYTMNAHSAVFIEVKVDETIGKIDVVRVVSAVAAGRILNPKTATSQVLGGVVWGIGMALEEESVLDHRFGRFATRNLADYHVPVNADVPQVDVIFVKEEDSIVNPLGVKGLGEIGLVGVAAALANAVFHATGRRIRDLPITLDKLL